MDKDKYIQEILEKVKDIIVRRLNPRAIVLFGGFGKGEGTIEVKGSRVTPINDIDFYVVSDEKISDELLENVSKEASKCLNKGGVNLFEEPDKPSINGNFHVEVRALQYSKLPKLLNTVRTYELKNSSKIIYGENILEKVPDLKREEIPFSEGVRNLINRSAFLLLCMNENRFKRMNEDERKTLIYASIKGFLGCAESLLVFCKKYEATYKKRNQIFQKIYKKEFPELAKQLPDLPKQVNFATKFKLNPRFDIVKDPVRMWFISKQSLLIVFKHISSKILKCSDDWITLSKEFVDKMPLIYFQPYIEYKLNKIGLPKGFSKLLLFSQYYLTILYALNSKKLSPLLDFRDPGLKMAPSILMTLDARKEDYVDENLIALSKKYLKGIVNIEGDEWSVLRKACIEAYKNYYLMPLV